MRKNWRPGVANAGREQIAAYYAAITAIDDQVGRLMRTPCLGLIALLATGLVVALAAPPAPLARDDTAHKLAGQVAVVQQI